MQTTSSDQNKNAYESLSPLAEIHTDLLGFAFHPAWIYLLFYGSGALGDVLGHGENTHDLAYFLSMAPLILATLFGVIATKRFMTLATSMPLVIGAPLATALGTLFYVANAVSPASSYLPLAGILTGFGSALVAARWAALFGRFSARAVVANLPLLLFLQAALCLSISYLSIQLQVALLVALPLAGGSLLWWSERRASTGIIGSRESHPAPSAASVSRSIALFLAFVFLIGFVSALLGAFGRVDDRFDYGAWLDIAITLLVLLFVGQALFLTTRSSFVWLFVMPTSALLLVLLPQMRLSSDFLADVVYPIGAIVFELLLLFASTLLARMQHASPARMYMAGRFVYALSDVIGSLVGAAALGHWDAMAIAHGATIVLMSTVGLLFTAALIFALVNGAPLFIRLQGEGIPTDNAETQGPPTAPGAPDNSAPLPLTPHEAIVARCQELGEQFSLSDREREVLVLIAEGRSSARIQEDLSIAAGTVNYHTRNIYAKLGVHSRQEIIDMILRPSDAGISGVDN